MLYKVGITFHSCGRGDKGYIPNDHNALISHFNEIKKRYLKDQPFWARKENIQTSLDEAENHSVIAQQLFLNTPHEMRRGTISNMESSALEATAYWTDRNLQLNEKINSISNNSGETSRSTIKY